MATVGVCGFGRCGSTMVMAMLDAGGLPPVEGSQPISYELSPNLDVAYEQPPIFFEGRAVKLLDAVLHMGIPAGPSWRFVWIDRDGTEQAKSTAKFLKGMCGIHLDAKAQRRLTASYETDRPVALASLRLHGPVVVVRYEAVLSDPLAAAQRLRDVWPALDVKAAAAVVHDRDGACRPDLSFEAVRP